MPYCERHKEQSRFSPDDQRDWPRRRRRDIDYDDDDEYYDYERHGEMSDQEGGGGEDGGEARCRDSRILYGRRGGGGGGGGRRGRGRDWREGYRGSDYSPRRLQRRAGQRRWPADRGNRSSPETRRNRYEHDTWTEDHEEQQEQHKIIYPKRKSILKPQCKDQSTGTENINNNNNMNNANSYEANDSQYSRRRPPKYRDSPYPQRSRHPTGDHYGQRRGQARQTDKGYGHPVDNGDYIYDSEHTQNHNHTEMEKKLAYHTKNEPLRIHAARRKDRVYITLLTCLVVVMGYVILTNNQGSPSSSSSSSASSSGKTPKFDSSQTSTVNPIRMFFNMIRYFKHMIF